MTPNARLLASIELIEAIEHQPRRPADAVANSFFRERRYIGGGDRRAVSAQVWNILRTWRRLCWWLRRSGVEPTPRLMVAAYMILEGRPLEGVSRAFSGGRYAPDTLEAVEVRGLRLLDGHTLEHPEAPEAVRLELPDWLLPVLHDAFGSSLHAELAALSGPAPLDLRTNLLRSTREEAAVALRSEGIETEYTPFSPWGLRAPTRAAVTATTSFRSGLVEIQDEGSQLVVQAVAAEPGMRVLDYCAGAGGKTLGIAMTMHNRGHIVACDVSEPRLDGAIRRLRRAGVHNAERHLLVGGDKWIRRRAGSFDRVLVDAPCSGTGTWRRNPDSRLRFLRADLDELLAKQVAIMDRAAALVRPGGRLIYATCSILPEENTKQVEAFASRHQNFVQLDLNEPGVLVSSLPTKVLNNKPYICLSPAQHGTDGFFCAVFLRNEQDGLGSGPFTA